jgi:hypothetical protein
MRSVCCLRSDSYDKKQRLRVIVRTERGTYHRAHSRDGTAELFSCTVVLAKEEWYSREEKQVETPTNSR